LFTTDLLALHLKQRSSFFGGGVIMYYVTEDKLLLHDWIREFKNCRYLCSIINNSKKRLCAMGMADAVLCLMPPHTTTHLIAWLLRHYLNNHITTTHHIIAAIVEAEHTLVVVLVTN
jgi:hypothetical protein